jgi:hypothetical protein
VLKLISDQPNGRTMTADLVQKYYEASEDAPLVWAETAVCRHSVASRFSPLRITIAAARNRGRFADSEPPAMTPNLPRRWQTTDAGTFGSLGSFLQETRTFTGWTAHECGPILLRGIAANGLFGLVFWARLIESPHA